MKQRWLFIVSILMILGWACGKPPKDEEWGVSLLYIPQAAEQSGGVDNNFNIDISASGADDTSIVVGLYHSGLGPLGETTVDFVIATDTLAAAIDSAQSPGAQAKYDIYKNARLLDPKYYSMPAKITLDNGERKTYVNITLNKKSMLADPGFGDFVYILPVEIKNPTNYILNTRLSLVMFILEKK